MKYAIVGNNDGPLKLLESLLSSGSNLPVKLGFQNNPGKNILQALKDIPVPYFNSFNEELLVSYLKDHEIDVLINCFANFKFKRLLSLYDCYNVHPSLLPSYKGRHPMHWCLINGEAKTGITIHRMSKEIDEGPIFWQRSVEIYTGDSVPMLRDRLLKELTKGFPLFIRNLQLDNLKEIKNNSTPPSYFPPRKPEDSQLFEWSEPDLIFRKVKALRDGKFPAYLLFTDGQKSNIHDVKWATGKVGMKGKTEVINIEDHRILISFSNGKGLWLEGNELNQYDYQEIQWNRPTYTSDRS